LVLLDVMMPDIDGMITFEKLREHPTTRHIPVILLTAKTQTADRHRYAQLKVCGIITKPYDPLTLADQILEILG
jgi:CheY-like chemotaxis protein